LLPALPFAILATTPADECRPTDVIGQPEKRYFIAWTVLAALVVMTVVAINLVVHVQAI
jgi:hypothetical protein